jgi:hypothetical protein
MGNGFFGGILKARLKGAEIWQAILKERKTKETIIKYRKTPVFNHRRFL